jgi:bifunctional non-homologous end joining protein LigD
MNLVPTAAKGVITVEGHELTISNPEKMLFPEKRITKLMFLEKLAALAPYLIPYCRDRYLTTIRFPDGAGGKSFYQKNCPEPVPAFVRTSTLQGINYVNLDSLATLMWLGNLACVEYHPSFHRIGERLPAEWIIDIDPSLPEEPRIMHAACLVGELLDSLKIASVPKTSGATGVQIYVPIRRGYTFAQLRSIGEFICTYLAKKHPRLFTIERFKKNRGDRIYLDYLQHWTGKTLSAPYTPRGTPHATVSTPLTWEEVRSEADPRNFHLLNIEERLRERGDLLQSVPPQNLDAILRALT